MTPSWKVQFFLVFGLNTAWVCSIDAASSLGSSKFVFACQFLSLHPSCIVSTILVHVMFGFPVPPSPYGADQPLDSSSNSY